ncbi:AAA family ATPase [Candidatus Palauibacter sp.]|uniref:AAA family ATPase n=1 Tax=Candidatus Palauibacter sp. TaxID=3101350 RepID=UPI003B014F78
MASAEQLKALLRSHLEGDNDRFISVAMQVAAHEAKVGHGKLATELRDIIDKAKSRRGAGSPVPIGRPRGELANLLEASFPKVRLGDMILGKALASRIDRVIREQRHAGEILDYGLSPRRKLLLVGPPGTGKTLSASVLAGELGLPLLQVRLDGLITRFMGETAAKLRQIFDATGETRGVYFFDEFDAIGSERGIANDVGEIRRVLNSFLQMIEQDDSHSIVMAATNHPRVLDRALFRRFDDILHFEMPDECQIAELLKTRVGPTASQDIAWSDLAERAVGLSFADVARVANDVLKDALIGQRQRIQEEEVRAVIDERKAVSNKLAASGA